MSLRDYFSNNRIFTGTEKPTQGKFDVGDIIVNIGHNSAEEPMWICVEAGTPGVWELCSGVNEEEIGNMNELQTTDKSSIVGAINELFQYGVNVKQNLVDALIAKGVDCSTSDSFDDLIGNVNNFEKLALKLSVKTELPVQGNDNEYVILCSNPDADVVFYDLKIHSTSNLPEQCIVICTPHDCTMFEINYGILPIDMSLGEVYYKDGTEYTELETYKYENNEWRLYSNIIVVSKFFTNHPYTYTGVSTTGSVSVNNLNISGSVNSLWSAGIQISGLPAGRYKFTVEFSVGVSRITAGNMYIKEYQSETSTSYGGSGGTNELIVNEINASDTFSLTAFAAGGTANISSISITNAKLIRLYD